MGNADACSLNGMMQKEKRKRKRSTDSELEK